MKTIFFLTLILLFPVFISAQVELKTAAPKKLVQLTVEETKANAEVTRLNAEVKRLFGEKDYDEALKQAQKAVETAEAAKLFDKGVASSALVNLAEIYLAKSKENEAADLFLRAAATLEKGLGTRAAPQVVKYLERAAAAEVNRGMANFVKARDIYLELLALKEQIFGAQSREVIAALDDVAEVYRFGEKYDEAEQYFQRAVTLSDQLFKPEDKEYGRAFDRYQCFNYQIPGLKLDGKYSKNFEAFAKNRNVKYQPAEEKKAVAGGIVNSKAIYLARPRYPDAAVRPRLGGVAIVQVTIDENGKVTSAEPTCGYNIFTEEAVRSARQSTFSPTVLNGTPVKVTGVIIYKFIRD
jgi:TonB family protein